MPKSVRCKNQNSSFLQLPLPLHRQPFLLVKRKLREKDARTAIDGIEKYASLLKFKLETGAIQSPEARLEIRCFLEMLGLM